MENDNLLAGLIRKRAEIAGMIEATETQLRQLIIDIDNVDATIRLFKPDIDLAEIKPKPMPPRHAAFKGEVSRLVFQILRETPHPLSCKEITLRLMSERSLNTNDVRLVRTITKRVGACLKHNRGKGSVRSKAFRGQMLAWEIAK